MFRATANHLNAQALHFSARFTSQLAVHQRNISSGIRLHRPSDDPLAFRQASSLSSRLQDLRAERFTVQDAQTKLNFSVSQLLNADQILTQAKTLTQQGIQAFSQSERNALAIEVEGLLSQMKELSQSKLAGTYMYGGTHSSEPPFRFSDPSLPGRTLDVEYRGSQQASRAFVGQSVAVDTFFPGDEIFGGPVNGSKQREATVLMGQTGVRSGSGTDNMLGRATLQIRHTETNFTGGSGVAAGTSSVGNDTIIGSLGRHSLQVVDTSGDGSAGWVSLNGGPPTSFDNTMTNLQVKSNDGQFVFIDTTNIAPGFDDEVPVTANGTYSIDGGQTTVPIDFSNNQAVFDSITGRFINLDGSNLRAAGEEYLDFPGTSNAFQVLHELVLDLRGSRKLTNADQAATLDRRLGELNRISDQILEVVGQQSASLQTMRQLEFQIGDFLLSTEEQLVAVQATDIAETVLRMQNDQNLLQYTYSVTANILSTQLINFLR